jgi:hypothetical protein
MSPDLDALLCERYPRIFAERHASIQQSCMPWGFCCGDGWFLLIDELCAGLQHMTDHENAPQVVAVQVKEKFSTLRFYVHSATEQQYALIDHAANCSAETCETCGAPGQPVVQRGWYRTRCAQHAPQDAMSLAELEGAKRSGKASS